MAYSKTFLLLGLAFAVVLLISSEVSARELAQTQGSVQVDEYGHEHDHGNDGHGNGYDNGHDHGHDGHGNGYDNGHDHGHDGHGNGYDNGHDHGHGGYNDKPGHGGRHPPVHAAAGETVEAGN